MNQKMREKMNFFLISKRTMKEINFAGKGNCCCACAYAEKGGSSSEDNGNARIIQVIVGPLHVLRSTKSNISAYLDR